MLDGESPRTHVSRRHERTERLQRDNRTLVGPARISRWTSYREVSRTRNVRHGASARRGVALTTLATRAETRRSGEAERSDGGRAYRGPARRDVTISSPRLGCRPVAPTRAHPLTHAGSPSAATSAGRSHTGCANRQGVYSNLAKKFFHLADFCAKFQIKRVCFFNGFVK